MRISQGLSSYQQEGVALKHLEALVHSLHIVNWDRQGSHWMHQNLAPLPISFTVKLQTQMDIL